MLKKDILRNKEDFASVYKKGKSLPDRYVVIFYKRNYLPYNRLAFLASKKVGNSVQRNRAKRLMKEGLRVSNYEMKTGYDIIFIARNTVNGKAMKDVKRSLSNVVRRAKLLKDN